MKKVFSKISNLANIAYLYTKYHFFQKSTISERCNGVMELGFKKVNNGWYADLPEWKGAFEQCLMVGGADDLCESLYNMQPNKEHEYVKVNVSVNPFDGCDLVYEQIDHDSSGATYECITDEPNIPKRIWLCNVTHFVMGEHPEVLFIEHLPQQAA